MFRRQFSSGTTPAWQRKEGKSPSGGLNKAGSGEKMRSPGSAGAPTAKALKESQT